MNQRSGVVTCPAHIKLIYWVVLKSKYVCLKDWADDIRKTPTGRHYPFNKAVELIDEYWTGKSKSIFR